MSEVEKTGAWSHRGAIDDLSTLRIFVAVIESGSFTEAGRRMRIVPSTVSKHISGLESRLRGQLITRSTQRLSVTELGRRFYERCLTILQEVDEAENEVGQYQSEPQGRLRISAAPVLTVRHLMPVLNDFLRKYPKVSLDLTVTTVPEDLVANGIDAAIRLSNNLDPNLVAVKLGPSERIYCVAPSYIERHGRPGSVADLVDHNCLVIQNLAQSAHWPMRLPDGTDETVVVSGNFVSSNADTVRQALVAGLGIGYLARFIVDEDLASGALIDLFPDQRRIVSNIYVVFPQRRNLPLKTRTLVDFLKAEFRSRFTWTAAG